MEISTKTAIFSIDQDNILVVKLIKTEDEIDLEEAKAHIAAADKLFGAHAKDVLVLVDASDAMIVITKEAKEYISSVEYRLAEAIVVKELHQRIIATFYLKLSNHIHKHPVKVFKDVDSAKTWLLSLK